MQARSTPPSALPREEAQALAGLVALFAITASWWALALWPVQDGPAWLERTRYVCFGVREHGLPDGGGWIGLIVGPAGMLTILLAGWWRGVQGLLQRARSSRTLAGTLSALALGVMLLVTGAAVRVQAADADVALSEGGVELPPASYPRLDRASPALVLVGQGGDTIDLARFRGRPVLVTFAYAHCTTICPLIVTHVLQAQRALRGQALEPAVLIVTLDPWRDPPSRLAAMARDWSLPAEGAWVLSGSVESVERALDAWEVPRTRDEATGTVTHPTLVYVIDADGRIAFASNGGAEAIASLVRRLGE